MRHSRRAVPMLRFTIALIGGSSLTYSAPATAQAGRSAGSLTLQDVLGGLARHPVAEAAGARVRGARAARTTAGVFGNPVLNYDVENAPFPNGQPVRGVDREAMTTVTLPIETVLQRGPRAHRADADLRAAEADVVAARQQLALDAARAYFETALAQVRIEISRDLIAWLDTVVVYNRARVEEGVAAEAELIRAEVERDRATAQLTLHEAEHARMRAELAAFLDMPTAAHLSVTVDDRPVALPMDAAERPNHEGVHGTGAIAGVDRRPDVRAARARLTAAGAGISAQRSMILRELGATFGAKRTVGTTSMVAGLSIPLPIFDQNRGEIARAAAERDVASFELEARERNAEAELTGAYEAARLLTDRSVLLAHPTDGRPSFLDRADEGRRIALGAYREGAVPLLQVIDAARAWGEARMAYYEMLRAQHESVALLLYARGDDLFTELPALASRAHATPR